MPVFNYRTIDIKNIIYRVGFRSLDVLLVGATGVGKSSTINALFGEEKATVGNSVWPETQDVEFYQINNFLRIWDSPGLGDGKNEDSEHAKKLVTILNKKYTHEDGTWGYIDLVMVILDGSHRDYGTVYRLLDHIILKNIQPERVMILINKSDLAMSGRHWDEENNKPDSTLMSFLANQSESIQSRIQEATGLIVKHPICYSTIKNYNLEKIIDALICTIPDKKRPLPNVSS